MEGKAEEQCKQWRGRDGRDGWLWIAAEGVGGGGGSVSCRERAQLQLKG